MKSGAGGCETLPTPRESFQLQAKSYAIEHIQTAMTITEHNAVPVSLILNPVFGVALVCKKGDNVHDILFAQQDDFVGLVSHGEPPCGWWVENSLFLSTHILYTIFLILQAGSLIFYGFFCHPATSHSMLYENGMKTDFARHQKKEEELFFSSSSRLSYAFASFLHAFHSSSVDSW